MGVSFVITLLSKQVKEKLLPFSVTFGDGQKGIPEVGKTLFLRRQEDEGEL